MNIFLRISLVIPVFIFTPLGMDAGEVVFERNLSPTQRLHLIRSAIPFKPPSPEEEHSLKTSNPGADFMKPDAVYQYSLTLSDGTGGASRTIWTTEFKFYDREPAVPSHFKLLDVAQIGTNQILIIAKAGMSTGCHFASTTTNTNRIELPIAQQLYSDKPAFGKIVVAGHYYPTNSTEGAIELELAIHEKVMWHLKGQRLEQEVERKAPNNNPFAPQPTFPNPK